MKVGICHHPGTFSERWIEYCEKNNVPYKLVDAYSSDIIEQLQDCDVFMWHFSHVDYRDSKFAKQLIFALEKRNIRVFPNARTCEFFDDKLGQKYLLEAIGAPIVPTYAFYSKKDALSWTKTTNYPKVFKLRCGAGSSNVLLVRSQREAKRLISRSFGRGFSTINRVAIFKDYIKKIRRGILPFSSIIKAFGYLVVPLKDNALHGKEMGYVMFQDFIPNNTFDIRVVVTGNKAFAIKRLARDDDFRASGSGVILYEKEDIDERCVALTFSLNRTLKYQSLAVDFVFDSNKNPLLVEIGYGYAVKVYDSCPGYWDEEMKWHEEKFNPQYWQIENLLYNDRSA